MQMQPKENITSIELENKKTRIYYIVTRSIYVDQKILVVIEFGKKSHTREDPGYIFEYERWREQYETIRINNKITKKMKDRRVDNQYLMVCGSKAINLRDKYGDDFVNMVKLNQTTLHNINSEKLIEYIDIEEVKEVKE
ncbi:hypothetical protein Glove_71g140 [Diversispora epigaea]|uniref:Uncharacterized protein n=1 Tax=Diversispora epigaea TaxID=1348612 RepID=A0A397JJB0_9GLOM|nr:hypothetical protein Glove_71g140 [Diversispora epigaea]